MAHGRVTTTLVFAPERIAQSRPSILKAAVSKDPRGVAWSSDGVARSLDPSPDRPNVYKLLLGPVTSLLFSSPRTAPVSFIPSISKMQPGRARPAAFQFVWLGKTMGSPSHWSAYQTGLASVDAATLVERFLSLLTSSQA